MKRAFFEEPHAWYGSPWDPKDWPPPPPKTPPDDRHTSVPDLRALASRNATVLQRVGLVLGRFHPPHLGHLHLVEQAFAQCGWLHLVTPHRTVGNREHEDLFQFAFQEYGDRHRVTAPTERPSDPASWAAPLREMNLDPKPTHLFSSDRGAQALADAMHLQHVLVDPDRKLFPMASSKIRADLKNHIHWLVPAVRSRVAFQVGVIGAEGSGKSTLCRELAAVFEADVVEDPLLVAARARGAVPDFDGFFAALDEGAKRNWQAKRQTHTGIVISEASRFVGILWAERLGMPMDARTRANAEVESRALWLLCHNDFPYAGERDEPEKRRAFFDVLRAWLVARNQPFVDIVGEGQARVEIAVREIRARFDAHIQRRQELF